MTPLQAIFYLLLITTSCTCVFVFIDMIKPFSLSVYRLIMIIVLAEILLMANIAFISSAINYLKTGNFQM